MMNKRTRFQALAERSRVSPCVQNVLLAARAPALAADIMIRHPVPEREWKQALGIPGEMPAFAAIPARWPQDNSGPVRR